MPLSVEDVAAAAVGVDESRRSVPQVIPIIDVAPLLQGTEEGLHAVARQFDEAYRQFGFCYIRNHGIPQDLIDSAFAALPRFFELPESEKAKVPINTHQRGWLPLENQTQLHGKLPNYSESFMFGTDLPADDPDRLSGKPFYATNQWPEAIPEFRQVMEAYWRAVRALAPQLMRALAVSMRQHPDFFVDKCRKPPCYVRCVTYPPKPGPFDGQFGAGPHTDTGGLTILMQDTVGGLQIRTLDGHWINAPSIPGTYVLNIGDMIMRLTNGYFRSTPHRVLCGDRRRYSLPFFFGFDYDVEIAPLPEFCSQDNPPKWPPVVWGDYTLRAFKKQYSQFQAAAGEVQQQGR